LRQGFRRGGLISLKIHSAPPVDHRDHNNLEMNQFSVFLLVLLVGLPVIYFSFTHAPTTTITNVFHQVPEDEPRVVEKLPPVSVSYAENDMGLPTLLRLVNTGRAPITITGVKINDEFVVDQYMLGVFQGFGELPATIDVGSLIIFNTAPYTWERMPVRANIVIDGIDWEFALQ